MVDGDANKDNLRASTTSSDGGFPPPEIFEDKIVGDARLPHILGDARLPPLDIEVAAFIGGDTIATDESSNDSLIFWLILLLCFALTAGLQFLVFRTAENGLPFTPPTNEFNILINAVFSMIVTV
jgi:hypothetical protein